MTREELLRLSSTELIEIILRLQERIVSLEAQVASLQESLAPSRKPEKTSRNSSVPPSKSYKPNRRRSEGLHPSGPKPGHEGRSRTRQTPAVVIACRPTVCTQCGHDLEKVEQTPIGTSQGIYLPPIEPIVVEAHRKSLHALHVGANRRLTLRRDWIQSGCLDRRSFGWSPPFTMSITSRMSDWNKCFLKSSG